MGKFTAVLLMAGVALAALPLAAADHPIAGVIGLLEKLEVQTKEEGAVEAATYQKFQYWCKRSTRRLSRAIKKEEKAIGELADKIKGLTADIETATEDIAAYEAQLEVLDKQAQKAQAMRGDEHELYEDDVENLDDTIRATDDALVVLQEEEARAQVAFFQASPEDLLKLDPSKGNPFKPKAKSFSAHAGGVIETFKKLEEDWGIDKPSMPQVPRPAPAPSAAAWLGPGTSTAAQATPRTPEPTQLTRRASSDEKTVDLLNHELLGLTTRMEAHLRHIALKMELLSSRSLDAQQLVSSLDALEGSECDESPRANDWNNEAGIDHQGPKNSIGLVAWDEL